MTWVWIDGDPAGVARVLAQHGARPSEPSLVPPLPPPRPGLPTILQVQDAVARAWGTSVIELQSHHRIKHLVTPRHVAMYLARDICQAHLTAIGAAFGKRDHSSVHYAIEKVARNLLVDPALEARVQGIREMLGKTVLKPRGKDGETLGKSSTSHIPGEVSTMSTDVSTPPEGPEPRDSAAFR